MKLTKPSFRGIKLPQRGRQEGRFNPAEKISIHNPLPQRLWPFKFGEKVYVALEDCVIGAIVDWYLPARQRDACPMVWCVTDGPRVPFSPASCSASGALGAAAGRIRSTARQGRRGPGAVRRDRQVHHAEF